MKTHRFNYPAHLIVCQFCQTSEMPKLESAIVRMPDGRLTTAFRLVCSECGYQTKDYEYPDIVCHAWNMAKKLEISELIDEVAPASKKDNE